MSISPLCLWRRAGLALLFGTFSASNALGAPPAAPVVTVGADIKRLDFDWDYVPRANSYELWFKANDGAAYVKFGATPASRPHISSSISAHLLDWDQARYLVKACNPSGCNASVPIGVSALMSETIGYFKPSSLHNNARFGLVTAISEDGNTLAAFTASETTPAFPKAAVYVFTKVDGRWRQQARLFPESSDPEWENMGLKSEYYASLSLSADGKVLMAYMPFHKSPFDSGGLTVYRRSGETWTAEYRQLRIENVTGELPGFAQMSETGDRILYKQNGLSRYELIVRTTQGWQVQPAVQPSTEWICVQARLSGNEQVLAFGCSHQFYGQDRLYIVGPADAGATIDLPFPDGDFVNQLAIDYSGDTVAIGSAWGYSATGADGRNQVRVYRDRKDGSGTWTETRAIFAGSWAPPEERSFGNELALSHDGGLLAILHPRDAGAGMGVLSPPLQPGTEATGATYVYELLAEGPRLRRVLKPNNAIPAGGLTGGKLGFANNGRTLVVSEPDEPGNSYGIDGNRNAGGRLKTGAIWLY